MIALAMRDVDATGSLVLRVLASTFLASGLVTAGATRGRHLAWVIMLAIATLTWIAA